MFWIFLSTSGQKQSFVKGENMNQWHWASWAGELYPSTQGYYRFLGVYG